MNFTMEIPKEALAILSTLQSAGFEAYLVGGCVRDALLGRKANDFDIATSALPKEVKALFPQTFDSGIKHGTVTVLMDKKSFEVTTYRIDGDYRDNRHPDHVTFTPSLREDLKRRDFTVNAFAYNPKNGLVDLFDGLKDLTEKRIRAVGDPERRFEEDALRILRAVRFCAQLGFTLDEDTRKACQEKASLLRNVSAERIRDEVQKMLLSPNPEILILCHELSLTPYFLPELDVMLQTKQENPYHFLDVGRHSLMAVKNAPMDPLLRWVLLLHDSGKPIVKSYDEKGIAHFYRHEKESARIAQEVLTRLRIPKKFVHKASFLILHHGDVFPPKEKSVRREITKVGIENFPLLIEIQKADSSAQSEMARKDHLERIAQVEKVFAEIKEKEKCFSLKDLAVHGDDLIKLGIPPGKEIGKILKDMFQYVLDNPQDNTKDILLSKLDSFR